MYTKKGEVMHAIQRSLLITGVLCCGAAGAEDLDIREWQVPYEESRPRDPFAESESLETAKRMLPIIDTRPKDHQKMKIAVAISSICRNTKDPGVDPFVAEAYGPKILSIINAEGTTEYFRINFTLVLGKACSPKNEGLIKQVKDPEPEVELAMDKALAEIRARVADKGKP